VGVDAEGGAGADERVFEEAEVGVEVFAAAGEVKDGVADELAGAVVGGLAAAVGFEEGGGGGAGASRREDGSRRRPMV
jgi:hypothetical protein